MLNYLRYNLSCATITCTFGNWHVKKCPFIFEPQFYIVSIVSSNKDIVRQEYAIFMFDRSDEKKTERTRIDKYKY